MHGVIAAAAGGSAWSFGGSILTFAFPMILFIVVAAALYVLYTKPELVPGHRNPAVQRPMIYTTVPGETEASPGEKAAAAGALRDSRAEAPGAASSAVSSAEQEPEAGE